MFKLSIFNIKLSHSGGQTARYSQSHNRETFVSEFSVCLWGSKGVVVCRAKLAASGLSNRLAVVHQVRRGLTMERLVDDGGQFMDDPSSSSLSWLRWTDNHFADNQYRQISTLVSAGCRLHNWQVQAFIFITKSKQTWQWFPFLVKVGAFCNFAFGCVFVLSALYSPSSKSRWIKSKLY